MKATIYYNTDIRAMMRGYRSGDGMRPVASVFEHIDLDLTDWNEWANWVFRAFNHVDKNVDVVGFEDRSMSIGDVIVLLRENGQVFHAMACAGIDWTTVDCWPVVINGNPSR